MNESHKGQDQNIASIGPTKRQALCALRFLFKKTLGQARKMVSFWIRLPKKYSPLPTILQLSARK